MQVGGWVVFLNSAAAAAAAAAAAGAGAFQNIEAKMPGQ
jgi:hypothetical protein